MNLSILAVGLIGPGFSDWDQARPVLNGLHPYELTEPVIPPPEGLASAERRRVPQSVKIALAAAHQVFAQTSVRAQDTQTVFASSGGDGKNCHDLCEALAQADPFLSPTRFTNSVHNAAAGYWGIATGSMQASASICAHDASFAAGFLEAATMVVTDLEPVGLIAYDVPYPAPLHAKRPICGAMAVAMILGPHDAPDALARITLQGLVESAGDTAMAQPDLEALRAGVPAARSLPLLVALAGTLGVEVTIEAMDGQSLKMRVVPCN